MNQEAFGGAGWYQLAGKSNVTLITAAAIVMLASSARAQGFRYEPGNARYEQTVVLGSPQTLASLGAPAEVRSRFLLSTAISRLGGAGSDSLLLRVTVDSAMVLGLEAMTRGAPPIPPGTTVERRMTVLGRSADAASGIRTTDQLVAAIIPPLIHGASPGSTWEDTIPVDILGGGGFPGLSGRLARSFLLSKDTTYEGEGAWKIDVGTRTTVVASGTTNVPITVDGGGDGTGVIFLSKRGALLYSSESQTLVLNIRLQSGG